MNILEILLISLSVSTDAFAVSIYKGLMCSKLKIKYLLNIGSWFGIFQFMMPLIGYILSNRYGYFINIIGKYIASIILIILGINMIKSKEENNNDNILILAISTSIDAMSVGIAYNYAYGSDNHMITFIMMGLITFIMSIIGVFIGYKYNKNIKATLLGGLILLLIGIKILVT